MPTTTILQSAITRLAEGFATEVMSALRRHLAATVGEPAPAPTTKAKAPPKAKPRPTAKAATKAKAKGSNIRMCVEPGCRRPSKGPRFGYRCENHRDAWAVAKAKGGKAKPKMAKKSKQKKPTKPTNGASTAAAPA